MTTGPDRAPLAPVVRGALWIMGSTLCWSCMAAVTRHFTGEIHTFEIVFFRSLFGTAFLLPWLFRAGFRGMRTRRVGMHMARGLVGLATIYLLFTALAQAPLGEVAAIIATRPIVASLAAVLILHEAARGRRLTATAIGFAGALVIIRPGFLTVSLGIGLALVGVIGMSALSLILKSLSRTEAPDTIVMWQMMVFTPLSLVPALFVWRTPTAGEFLLLASIGLFGTLTQRCLTRAYAAADATVVLPFDFTRLIFSAVLGFLLFAEFPDGWTWAGGALIFAAILWMTRGESRAPTEAEAARTASAGPRS